MTEQTPLERLEYEIGEIPLHGAEPDQIMSLFRSARAYINQAEARIKDLEAENSKLKAHDCWKEVTGG